VPLRLAVTDAAGAPDELSRLPGGGALWQDRLVARLLALDAQGAAGPWGPYMQVGPACRRL
jgi:hypothetical protein